MLSYNVAEHSKNSYQDLIKSGKFSRYKRAILKELAALPATRRTLAKKLKAGYPSNLCAPIKELEKEGLIKVIGSVQDILTGREVNLYGLSQAESPYISIGDLNTSCVHSEGLLNSQKTSL